MTAHGADGAPAAGIRLGDLLVEFGAITASERDTIIGMQSQTHRPFGVLAEERFGVDPGVIERAWAEQYSRRGDRFDPHGATPDPRAVALIDRRQAWQFAIVPIGFDHAGELTLCTSVEYLPRAMRFAGWRLGERVAFVLAEREDLGRALERAYPMGAGAEDLLPAEAVPGPRGG